MTLYTSPSCSGYYWAEADALSSAGGNYDVWVDDEWNANDGYSGTSALVSGGGLRACVSVYGASDQFTNIGCTDYH